MIAGRISFCLLQRPIRPTKELTKSFTHFRLGMDLKFHIMLMNDNFSIQILSEPGSVFFITVISLISPLHLFFKASKFQYKAPLSVFYLFTE